MFTDMKFNSLPKMRCWHAGCICQSLKEGFHHIWRTGYDKHSSNPEILDQTRHF